MSDLKYMDFEEIKFAVKEHREKMQKMVYIDEGHICLNAPGGVGEYPISLDRVDSAEKILSWIIHLSEKNWVTSEMLGRFVEKCCSANKITVKWS